MCGLRYVMQGAKYKAQFCSVFNILKLCVNDDRLNHTGDKMSSLLRLRCLKISFTVNNNNNSFDVILTSHRR